MYGSNISTGSSTPIATTSANGQIRKKSDLSCVGKLFSYIFNIRKKCLQLKTKYSLYTLEGI
jgi:hypothetical protein